MEQRKILQDTLTEISQTMTKLHVYLGGFHLMDKVLDNSVDTRLIDMFYKNFDKDIDVLKKKMNKLDDDMIFFYESEVK